MTKDEESRTIIAELRKVLVYVDSIHDLRTQNGNYARAIPTLVELLPVIKDVWLKEGIVRALGTKEAVGIAEDALIFEFKNLDSNLPQVDLVKWSIGNTLEIIASEKRVDDFVELATDKRYGRAREMIVLGLGKLRSEKSYRAIIDLLDDDDVCGHAAIAAGKLKLEKASPKLKLLLEHKNKWFRSEARKALSKICPPKKKS